MKPNDKGRHVIRGSDASPVYRQVAQWLERDLLRRRRRGSKSALPSESALSEEFGVSRVTVRQALDELHFKGLIYREKGRGSFARSRRIGGVTGFGSFTSEVEATGSQASSILVDLSVSEQLPEAMLRHLVSPLADSGGFHRLTRVRCVDAEPVAFEESYLPRALYPGLVKGDVATGSLYAAMRRLWGLQPAWADAALEPDIADAELASHLRMEPGAPVVVAWRVTSSEQDEVLEYVRSVYRGGGFALTIRHHRIG